MDSYDVAKRALIILYGDIAGADKTYQQIRADADRDLHKILQNRIDIYNGKEE